MKYVVIDISLIRRYIAANLGRIHSAKQIAIAFNCSQAYLRRRFLRVVGVTLGQYLIDSRIEVMEKQLQDPNVLCKTACLEAGYREDSGARAFKHETGMTMEEFRNEGAGSRD